ncbi:hypothetical protein [Streptomyces chilikensis]|uniref:Uncharacterized protein n=1 Tax=Streptomyces chilikensis TaxID=1194079 RepID=A0ABV3EHV4_9ACTN
MSVVVWYLAGTGGAVAWCVVVLVRRDRGRSTENVDGLLVEQQATARARGMRAEVGAFRGHLGKGGGSGSGSGRH